MLSCELDYISLQYLSNDLNLNLSSYVSIANFFLSIPIDLSKSSKVIFSMHKNNRKTRISSHSPASWLQSKLAAPWGHLPVSNAQILIFPFLFISVFILLLHLMNKWLNVECYMANHIPFRILVYISTVP